MFYTFSCSFASFRSSFHSPTAFLPTLYSVVCVSWRSYLYLLFRASWPYVAFLRFTALRSVFRVISSIVRFIALVIALRFIALVIVVHFIVPVIAVRFIAQVTVITLYSVY